MPRKHTIKAGIRDGCKGLTVPDILFTGVVSRWISQLIPDVQLVNRNSHLTADVCLQVATNYILFNSYLLDAEQCQTHGLLNKRVFNELPHSNVVTKYLRKRTFFLCVLSHFKRTDLGRFALVF